MAVSFVERFRDDFDDGSVGLTTDLGNGTASEAGGKLTLTCPAGLNGDWWSGASEYGPIAYEPVSSHITEPTVFKAELRLTNVVDAGIDTLRAGLTVHVSRDNAFLMSWRPNGDLAAEQIISDSGSGLATVGGVASPDSDPHTYRIYWSIAPRTYTEPDLSFSIVPGNLYFYYKLDSGSWTLLHSLALPFRAKRAGAFFKRWNTTPETSASFEHLSLQELVDDSLVIDPNSYDPSNTFEDATLPKTWSNRLAGSPGYTGNTVTMLSPGVRISNPTKYNTPSHSDDWAGITAAGWGVIGDGGQDQFDIELRWENLVLNDYTTAQPGNEPHFGLMLEWGNRNKEQAYNSITNVFVGRQLTGRPSPPYAHDGFVASSGNGYPGNFYNTKHGDVDNPHPNGSGEERVRLVRVSTTDYSAYYWDDESWQPIALTFTPVRGQPSDNLTMLSRFGTFTIGAFVHTFYPSAWVTVDLKEIKVNSGRFSPLYTTPPDDDFSDGVRDTSRYYLHTYDNLYHPNLSISEISGAVEWDLTQFFYDDEGIQWTHTFFPGTDIECVFEIEHEIAANNNYRAHQDAIFFHSPFAQKGPIPTQSGIRDEIQLYMYEDDPTGGHDLYQQVRVWNRQSNPYTAAGNRTDITSGSVPYTTTIKVRVTRVGNVWSFYTTTPSVSGIEHLVGSWTDTDGVLTDFPVAWGMESVGHGEQDDPKLRLTSFTVLSGDTELPPPTTPTVTQIENYLLEVTFGVPLDTTISEFNDAASYQIDSIGNGIDITITSAELVDENTIHLGVTLATDGEGYRFTILSSALFTEAGDPLQGEADDYVASVVGPRLISAVPLSSRLVRATFERDLQTTFDAKDTAKYVFTGGLTTMAVKRITPTIVDITTSEQDDNTIYQLTVNP